MPDMTEEDYRDAMASTDRILDALVFTVQTVTAEVGDIQAHADLHASLSRQFPGHILSVLLVRALARLAAVQGSDNEPITFPKLEI